MIRRLALAAALIAAPPSMRGAEEALRAGTLLDLALRSREEGAGDYDALAARWVEAVRARGRAEGSRPAAEPGTVAGLFPEARLLELLLRRLQEVRPRLADPGALIPRVEEASKLRYEDGLLRALLRGLLDDLYRTDGREEERRALRVDDGYLRRWAVIGPFGNSGRSQIRRTFPPEVHLDPDAAYPARKSPLRWRVPPRPDRAEGFVVPWRWVYPQSGVIYLLAQARAAREEKAVLHLGAREPVWVWVNGRLLTREDPDDARGERRAFEVRVAAGWNRILVKTLPRPGGWLWARLTDAAGEPLAGVALDEPIAAVAEKAADGSPKLLLHPQAAGAGEAGEAPAGAAKLAPWDEALERRLLERAPPSLVADARMAAALLHTFGGSMDRAVVHAEIATELLPGDAALQAHAARILLAARYLPRDHARARARDALKAALRADAGHLPAYLPLARLLDEDNEPARAAETLTEAGSRRPGFLAGRLELLDLFEEKGWEAEAQKAAAEIEALAPRSPAPFLYRSRWYGARGNPARALAEARAALERDRGSSKTLWEIARLCEEAGDAAGALEALERRRRLDPEDPEAAEALADFHEKRRDWDSAIEVQEILASRNPADPEPRKALGRLHERAGRPEEARAAYRAALEREPGDLALGRYLERLEGRSARDEFWKPHDESLGEWLGKIPPRETWPGANAVAVLDITVTRLYPDGSSSDYTHQAFRVLSEEAKDELASVSTPGEVIILRTVTADGRTLEPVPATGQRDYTLPAVAPGATVEWAYRVDRPRFAGWRVGGQAFYFQDFEFQKPFLLSRFAVILPPGLEVDLVERALAGAEARARAGGPPLAQVKREERPLASGGRVVVYEARDAARLERELGMPFREDYIPNVELLERRTWDEAAGVIEDDTLGLARLTHELERAAREVTAGREEALQKARAIYHHVNELVTESRGPRRAVEVLLTRSGDRTALYKALLEAAGVPHRWAFLRPRAGLFPRDDGAHPQPGSFSERYVLVEPEGSPPIWASLETRRLPFGKLPLALQGGLALALDPEGGARFTPVPWQRLEDSASSTVIDLTLSGEGIQDLGARARVELVARSLQGYAQKEALRTIKEDQKRQLFSGLAANLFPGARVASGDLPRLAEPEAPFSLRLELSAPRVLVPRGDGEALLRPVAEPLEMVKRFIQRASREHPYRLGRDVVIRDRSRIATGPAFRIGRVPQDASFTSDLGTYSLAFRREGTDGQGGEVLRVEREVTLLPATVPPAEFPRVVEFARAVDRAEAERVVLARSRPSAR